MFAQWKVYGLVVTVANKAEPRKNWTLLIDPSVSLATAAKLRFAGAVKVAALTGLVMLTDGARLTGGVTKMVTALDVVTAPRLSVALAVRL